MKKLFVIIACAFTLLTIAQAALADDNFHGIIENRPDGKVGTWVVEGRSVKVVENTELYEGHSLLEVGACAEVEIEDGVVEEIESEPPHKCAR